MSITAVAAFGLALLPVLTGPAMAAVPTGKHIASAVPTIQGQGDWPAPQKVVTAARAAAPATTSASASATKPQVAAPGAYRAAVVADAPAAYWRLDENSGPTAADSSGHAIGATYGTIGSYQKPGALIGDPDVGILAAGTAAITAPATALPLAATARTVEFWSTTTGCCGTAGVSYGNVAGGGGFSALYQYDGGRISVTDGTAAHSVSVPQPFNLDDGQWHLFDITYASSVVTFYVDGVAAGTGTLAGLATTAAGGLSAGSGGGFDEVAVYPTALSPARVAAHWTTGSSSADACAAAPRSRYSNAVLADLPTSYYRADDIVTNPKGRVAYDASSHCNNGSLRYTDTSVTGSVVGDADTGLAGGFSGAGATLPAGGSARTVEFWATAVGCCGQAGVAYGNLATGNGFDVEYFYDSGILSVGDGSGGLSSTRITQPFGLNDGKWHLFDLAYDGSTAVFYVDGVAAGTGSLAGLTTDTTVGLNATGRTLDEVAVYPAVLSAARVAAHWTAGSSTLAACAATPTGAYPGAVLADKPTSYYRAGDIATNAKGRVAYDSTSHCNNGSLRYTDRAATGAVIGNTDGALAGGFSAAGSTLPAAATARTVEFWATAVGCCGQAGVRYGDLANGNGFDVEYAYDSGVLTVNDGSSDIAAFSVTQPYGLNDQQWHLFDLTYNGTVAIFYVDGVAVGRGALAGLTTDTAVGLSASARTLDEVAVYPTALTAARIATHWTAGSSTLGACAPVPTGTYPAAVLADAPTSYYRAGDIATNAKGRVAYDSSSHCNNGSLRYTDSSTPGAITGDPDAATSGGFSAAGASLPAGATARTVEYWFTSVSCCGQAGVRYGALTDGNGFDVEYLYDGGVLRVGDGSSSLAQLRVTQPKNLDDGQWHLVDLVLAGGTATFYVDGVAAGSGPLAGLTTNTGVGLSASAPNLDEVAVYPTALTAARIAAHWNARVAA